MVTSSWFTAALGATDLLLSADGVLAKPGSSFFRKAHSPAYRSAGNCPERCSVSGSNPGNWSVYPNFQQIKRCEESMFYDFSLYGPVDDQDGSHRIHACSSFGPDFAALPGSVSTLASADPVEVNFQLGWWEEGFGLEAASIRSLTKQMREYAEHGHGATDRPFIMFGQSSRISIGIYIGQGLLNQGLGASALRLFQDNLANINVSTPNLAMQLCGPDYDSSHIFGVMETSNMTFGPIQHAIKTWRNATCLSFSGFVELTGQAMFTTPLVRVPSTPTNSTANSTTLKRDRGNALLLPRAECRTVQVESGDSCAALATKCGIPPAAFTRVNPASKFCATLRPKQHVCCSMGNLPDFSPSPNADGSCHSTRSGPMITATTWPRNPASRGRRLRTSKRRPGAGTDASSSSSIPSCVSAKGPRLSLPPLPTQYVVHRSPAPSRLPMAPTLPTSIPAP